MALHRSVSNRMIGGVCGGIAQALDWDPTLVRVLYVDSRLHHSVDPHALSVRLLARNRPISRHSLCPTQLDTLPVFARGAPGSCPTTSWKLRCTRGT